MSAGKLDPEFKARWVAALRSGEHKQARGRFFKDGGLCCLGVAAVLLGKPCDADLNAGAASEALRLSGVRAAIDEHNATRGGRWLPYMNDGITGEREHSFTEIADYIEANL